MVLDPLASSGTTVLTAKGLGRIGVGFDIDPLEAAAAIETTAGKLPDVTRC